MYPAIEIDLHLDRILCSSATESAALEAAFPAVSVRHQPAPFRPIPAKAAGRAVKFAGRRRESAMWMKPISINPRSPSWAGNRSLAPFRPATEMS
jgi:hypothetical protein